MTTGPEPGSKPVDWEARARETAERVERHRQRDRPLPSFRDWPPAVRAWLVYRMVMAQMDLYKSKQIPWEQMLHSAFVLGGAKALPGPDGRFYRMNGPLDAMYDSAVRLSADWLGSPEHQRFITLITGPEAP